MESAIPDLADDETARARGRSSESGEHELDNSSDVGPTGRVCDPLQRMNSGRGSDHPGPGTSSIDRYRIDPPADAPARPRCKRHRRAESVYVAIPVATVDAEQPALVRGWACRRCWGREEGRET